MDIVEIYVVSFRKREQDHHQLEERIDLQRRNSRRDSVRKDDPDQCRQVVGCQEDSIVSCQFETIKDNKREDIT